VRILRILKFLWTISPSRIPYYEAVRKMMMNKFSEADANQLDAILTVYFNAARSNMLQHGNLVRGWPNMRLGNEAGEVGGSLGTMTMMSAYVCQVMPARLTSLASEVVINHCIRDCHSTSDGIL
jgi:hypothetical protein